jgi:hypothetical protein
MKINAILFFLLPVFISGCNRSAPEDATVPSDQIVSLQNSLTADEARISVLEKQNKEPRRKQQGIGEQYQIMIRTPQAAGN